MSFSVVDDRTGQRLTAEQAEREMCTIILNPELAQEHWQQLGDIDWWLLILTLMACPTLRDEAWDAVGADGKPVLDERLKFWLTLHACENEGNAADLVRRVVRDVVAAGYREEENT
jgi:hypothetical protein